MVSNPFVGTWDLVEYWVTERDNTKRKIWPEFRGSLTYTHDGFVSVVICRHGISNLEIQDVIAYSGNYEVSGDLVLHRIKVSTVSRYIDNIESRRFSIKGENLTLETKLSTTGAHHQVIWRRVR